MYIGGDVYMLMRIRTFFMLLVMVYSSIYSDDFCVSLEPCWRSLGSAISERADFFGGKWVLIGTITMKKRARESIALCQLNFQWQGKYIDRLIGSLYCVSHDKKFIPTDEFLVSDAVWNNKKQQLQFKFNCATKLNTHTVFYLVLTVPEEIEKILRLGSFTIISHCLPLQMQDSLSQKNLTLSCCALDTSGKDKYN